MNPTPQLDNQKNSSDEPLVDPQIENLKLEKRLSDRILAYAFGASVLINLGWMIWVTHSDLFGKGDIIPPMKETQIKVFKRPLPPKPKKQVKPPPPPPKQKPPPTPPKPLPHIVHPTPPQPHRVNLSVHTTHNTRTANTINVPNVAPSNEPVTPAVPTYDTPTPPAPPVPPTPPAPVTPPAPPAPVYHAPPAPPPPPPPVVHPRNYSPINSQEAGPIGDFGQPSLSSDLDPSTLSSKSVTIAWEIDENGRASNVHVKHSCGNSDVDEACKTLVEQMRYQPAIQDHLKLRQSIEHTFDLG